MYQNLPTYLQIVHRYFQKNNLPLFQVPQKEVYLDGFDFLKKTTYHPAGLDDLLYSRDVEKRAIGPRIKYLLPTVP